MTPGIAQLWKAVTKDNRKSCALFCQVHRDAIQINLPTRERISHWSFSPFLLLQKIRNGLSAFGLFHQPGFEHGDGQRRQVQGLRE